MKKYAYVFFKGEIVVVFEFDSFQFDYDLKRTIFKKQNNIAGVFGNEYSFVFEEHANITELDRERVKAIIFGEIKL